MVDGNQLSGEKIEKLRNFMFLFPLGKFSIREEEDSRMVKGKSMREEVFICGNKRERKI